MMCCAIDVTVYVYLYVMLTLTLPVACRLHVTLEAVQFRVWLAAL